MFDNFLTDLLKIIIVVDVLAIIAYFMVGAGRRRAQMPAPSTQARIPAEGLSLESNRLPETIPAPSLRQRLERPFRRLWWRSRHTAPSSYSPSESLDTAFAKLRRVLTSYHEGLA